MGEDADVEGEWLGTSYLGYPTISPPAVIPSASGCRRRAAAFGWHSIQDGQKAKRVARTLLRAEGNGAALLQRRHSEFTRKKEKKVLMYK